MPLFPDVGPALLAAALARAGLKRQAAVAVLAGRLVAEQPAEVDKVFLGDAALFAGIAAPFGDEGLGGERRQQYFIHLLLIIISMGLIYR